MKFLPLDINEEFFVQLKFPQNEEYIDGKLVLTSGKSPFIEINSGTEYAKFFALMHDEKSAELLKCYSLRDVFTLVDCNISGSIIYPKILILGKLFDSKHDIKFTSIHLCLNNITQWFTNGRIKSTNEVISYEPNLKNFNEEIDLLDDKKIKISNRFRSRSERDPYEKRKIIIEEYPTIDIEFVNFDLSITELLDFENDVRFIFSSLMGYYSNTLYFWVKINNEEIMYPVYFSQLFKKNNILENDICGLIQYKYINENNKWRQIFTNYFTKPKIKKMWFRLLGLLRYDDIWEYRLIGFISILDKFVSEYKKGKEQKIPKKNFNNIKELFLKHTNDLLKDYENNTQYKHVVKSIKDQISDLKNSIHYFQDKFDLWFSELDEDIKKIVNFNEDDFKKLKKIRNKVAHGEIINYDEENHANLFLLENKLTLLLFYLLFCDFGFTAHDFIQNLSVTFHKLCLNSDLNYEHLYRTTGKVQFFKVSQETYDKIKHFKNKYDLILEKNKNEEYHFNEEKTEILQNNWSHKIDKEFKNIRDCITNLYSDTKIDIPFYGHAYLEGEVDEQTMDILSLCIVKKI